MSNISRVLRPNIVRYYGLLQAFANALIGKLFKPFSFVFFLIKGYLSNSRNKKLFGLSLLIIIFYTLAYKYPMLLFIKELGLSTIWYNIFCAISSCAIAFIIFELKEQELTLTRLVKIFFLSLLISFLFSLLLMGVFIIDEYFMYSFLKRFLINIWNGVNPVKTVYAQSDYEDDTSSLCSNSSSAVSTSTKRSHDFLPYPELLPLNVTLTNTKDGSQVTTLLNHFWSPEAVRPEIFGDYNKPYTDRFLIHHTSMDTLLSNIYNTMYHNIGQELINIEPSSATWEHSFNDIEQPWYHWTHTNSVMDIQNIHTLRCLISKITGHIEWLFECSSFWGDRTESILRLGHIRHLCELRKLEIENTFNSGIQVNSLQAPLHIARQGESVGESSTQGSTGVIRDATKQAWSRDRWHEIQATLARNKVQQGAFQAADAARLRNKRVQVTQEHLSREAIQVRSRVQQAAFQAADAARRRNAWMEANSSSSSSYGEKGKGKEIQK